MKSVHHHEADNLLDGRPADPASPWREVSDFLDNARLEAAAMPAPPPRPALAAILDGLRPVRTAPRTADATPRSPRVSIRLRPAAALLAAGAVTFGGLATAGALPAPLQRASAAFSSRLGIHLPPTPETAGAPRASTVPASPATSTATTTTGAPSPADQRNPVAGPEQPTTSHPLTHAPLPGVTRPTTVPAQPGMPTPPAIPPIPTLLGPAGPTGPLPLDARKETRSAFGHRQPAP